jgi:DNA-directed RNA polymerase specialized sigma24 family protein
VSNAQEKAFRRYLAELVRFLAHSRGRAQEATGTADKAYARLRRYALRAGDPDSYLFRIARAIAYDGRHRRARGSRHIG